MKTTLSLSALCVAALLASISLVTADNPERSGAPQWSAAQQEVWKATQALTASWTTSPDIHVNESLLHPEFLGLYTGDLVPDDKPTIVAWAKNSIASRKLLYLKQTPLNIKIEGDFAFVFAIHTTFFKDADGTDKLEHFSGLSVLKKEGGKWLLFAEGGNVTTSPE
jgi:hypothetical protein